MNTNDLTGTVIIPEQKMYDLLVTAAEQGAANALAAFAKPAREVPEYYTAKEAATELGYKSNSPLRKFHHKELNPVRRQGKRLFYKSSEVLKLKKRLFNL